MDLRFRGRQHPLSRERLVTGIRAQSSFRWHGCRSDLVAPFSSTAEGMVISSLEDVIY